MKITIESDRGRYIKGPLDKDVPTWVSIVILATVTCITLYTC